jgi:hypothetical protein
LRRARRAGTSGYDPATKVLTLELGGGVTEVVIAVPNKQIAVNHNPCVDTDGTAADHDQREGDHRHRHVGQ